MNGKFKVWDSVKKEWSKLGIFESYSIDQEGDLCLYNWAQDLVDPGSHLKIVHSTGQDDKNGVGLYDQDIFSCTKNDEKVNGLIFWNKGSSNWLVKFSDVIIGLADSLHVFKPEIIGNKYDNPELLETK